MKELLSAFVAFYCAPWKYLKQHILCSLLTFLVQLAIYLSISILLFEAFNSWFIDRVLYQIIGESISIVPQEILRFGTSLASPVLVPLILYLSWAFSINFSSIITGIFNSRLSAYSESAISSHTCPRMEKTRLFEISEDLSLLSFNVLFTVFLFLSLYFFNIPSTITSILFWLVTPSVYGLYNIGYALLPRRLTYVQMLRLAFSSKINALRFTGFSVASGLIPSLLAWLAASTSWNHLTFIILMIIFSLHRPFGIIAGTLLGNALLQEPAHKDSCLPVSYRLNRFIIIASGLFVFVNLLYFSVQLDSKVHLFSCRFTISKNSLANFNVSGKTLPETIVSLLSTPEHNISHLGIEIHNPTSHTIHIESLNIIATLGSHEIAKTSISGTTLAQKSTTNLNIRISLRPLSVLSSLKELLEQGTSALQIKAWVKVQTLLLPVNWPVTIVSL